MKTGNKTMEEGYRVMAKDTMTSLQKAGAKRLGVAENKYKGVKISFGPVCLTSEHRGGKHVAGVVASGARLVMEWQGIKGGAGKRKAVIAEGTIIAPSEADPPYVAEVLTSLGRAWSKQDWETFLSQDFASADSLTSLAEQVTGGRQQG